MNLFTGKQILKEKYPILIAEDDPVTRMLLKKVLVNTGYEVIVVENGSKALAKLNKRFFPIIITDWMMPEMNGVDFCRAIRNENYPGYIFIIILTSKDSKDDIVSGLESGADDYLIKPFNQAELLARINTGIRVLNLERSLVRAKQEIELLSVTDALTGSYNRSFMNEQLPKEVKRAVRYNRPLSIVFCDIDFFKLVNDNMGHQAGDYVLKEFVHRITKTIRSNLDWVARYGGEEFMIILPETSPDGAYSLAERLRRIISGAPFGFQGKEISVTASFGVASFHTKQGYEEKMSEELIKQADRFLYQAKEQGRNRVIGPETYNQMLML